jgi:hypothetical protein
MFNEEQKTLALEFARSLARRNYEQAYGMLSSRLQSQLSLYELREQFESMIPLDWGEVDPIDLEENPAWDEMFLYVVLGGSVYSEAVIIDSFVLDGAISRINNLQFGRP